MLKSCPAECIDLPRPLSNFSSQFSPCIKWQVVLKTVYILIGWLLQKPADQDAHCFQKRVYLDSTGLGLMHLPVVIHISRLDMHFNSEKYFSLENHFL